MIIHFHYSNNEHSGEIRRIRNINKDLAFGLGTEIIEVAFVSLQQIKGNTFLLNNKIKKKYRFPTIPFSNSNAFFKKINSLWTSLIIFILCKKYDVTHIIGEYSIAGQSLRFLPKKVTSIIDCHGALREEYEFNNINISKSYAEYLDAFERYSCNKANYIVCQSEEMKRHLISKYHMRNENKFIVYKCSSDQQLFHIDIKARYQMRKMLQIQDSTILFVYSGGLHKWQKINESISLFQTFHTLYPDSKLLLLTLEVEKAKEIINNLFPSIKEETIITSAKYTEVPSYLNACDIAFLLRDNTTLNAVASPTKLAEYMACGLPILSTSVSQYWIDNYSYIFNIDNQEISDLSQFIHNTNKNLISQYAHKYLSLENDQLQIQKIIQNEKSR